MLLREEARVCASLPLFQVSRSRRRIPKQTRAFPYRHFFLESFEVVLVDKELVLINLDLGVPGAGSLVFVVLGVLLMEKTLGVAPDWRGSGGFGRGGGVSLPFEGGGEERKDEGCGLHVW